MLLSQKPAPPLNKALVKPERIERLLDQVKATASAPPAPAKPAPAPVIVQKPEPAPAEPQVAKKDAGAGTLLGLILAGLLAAAAIVLGMGG